MIQQAESFIKRLTRLGITVELVCNYPWIYLRSVNGILIRETFQANHGFAAFILYRDGNVKITDTKEVFKQIRLCYNLSKNLKQSMK